MSYRARLLISGEWRDKSDGERITVLDPATGEAITEIAAGSPADATSACDAAPTQRITSTRSTTCSRSSGSTGDPWFSRATRWEGPWRCAGPGAVAA